MLTKKVMMPTASDQIQLASEPQLAPESAAGHANQPPDEAYSKELSQDEDHMDIDEELVYNDPDPEDSNYTSESSVTDQAISPEQETPPQRQSARQKPSNYLTVFVPKRKRSGPVDDEDIIEHRAKIMRAMAALAHDTNAGFDPDHENKLVIPVPETYDEAIKDPI